MHSFRGGLRVWLKGRWRFVASQNLIPEAEGVPPVIDRCSYRSTLSSASSSSGALWNRLSGDLLKHRKMI